MSNYDYTKDKPIADNTEEEVVRYLTKIFGWTLIHFNNDNKYDVLMFSPIRNKYITIEIKEDFTCKKTGNVGVEYSCRGKDSGIRVSEADLYFYKIHTSNGLKVGLIPTLKLKEMIREKLYHRTVNGGDEGSNSLCYLFYLDDFLSNSLIR